MPSAATITLNASPSGHDETDRRIIFDGEIAVTSGSYPSGGLALSWYFEQNKSISIAGGPIVAACRFLSIADPPSGYLYALDKTTGKLRVFTSSRTAGQPFVEINTGAPLTVTLHSGGGGTGYAVGDTGTITLGNDDATYTVVTESGGVVQTFTVAGGTGYYVATNVATATGGSQPGSGTGFAVDIGAVTVAVPSGVSGDTIGFHAEFSR